MPFVIAPCIGRRDEAVRTMEKVIDKRSDEMSPWVQTELVTFLGRL